jgi:cell division protein FtsQ
MKDFKARRLPKRRPLLRGRLSWLKRRNRRGLPKGFRPLTAPPTAAGQSSPLTGLAAPLGNWLKRQPILRWAYLGVLGWVLIGVAVRGWELWQAPLERVRVSGTLTLSSAQVVKTAGLVAGMRLSELDPYLVSLRLRQDPRVEAADARRIYPNTLWIDVRERIPDARVLLGDGRAALVDRYNVVIRVEPAQVGDLPLIRGVPAAAGGAMPGSVLAGPALNQARIFLTQAKEAGLPDLGRGILDLSEPDSIAVYRGEREGRLVFPLSRSEGALRAYRRLVDPAGPAVVTGAMSAAREADMRFVDGVGGGRVFLRP